MRFMAWQERPFEVSGALRRRAQSGESGEKHRRHVGPRGTVLLGCDFHGRSCHPHNMQPLKPRVGEGRQVRSSQSTSLRERDDITHWIPCPAVPMPHRAHSVFPHRDPPICPEVQPFLREKLSVVLKPVAAGCWRESR